MKTLILVFIISISSLYANLTILCSSKDGKIDPNHKTDLAKIQKIADSNGIKIQIKPTPWKRALVLIEKGKADGLINASYKDSRAVFAKYPMKDSKVDDSKRLNPGKTYYIYKNKNSKLTWNGKNFNNINATIGAVKGFAVIDDIKKHSNIKINIKTSRIALLRDASKNKISAFAGLEKDVNKVFKKYPKIADSLVKEPIPIRKKNYFLIFSKKTYQTKKVDMEIIWNGLK